MKLINVTDCQQYRGDDGVIKNEDEIIGHLADVFINIIIFYCNCVVIGRFRWVDLIKGSVCIIGKPKIPWD